MISFSAAKHIILGNSFKKKSELTITEKAKIKYEKIHI